MFNQEVHDFKPITKSEVMQNQENFGPDFGHSIENHSIKLIHLLARCRNVFDRSHNFTIIALFQRDAVTFHNGEWISLREG